MTLEGTRPQTPDEIREKLVDPAFLPTFSELVRAFSPGEGPQRYYWDDYCESSGAWEILTEEFIGALGDHLLTSAEKYGASPEKPLVVLEVGAGNGRLTHFLGEFLDKKAPGVFAAIATDNGEAEEAKPVFPVDIIDFQDALIKYQPGVVISSWMIGFEDWTPYFRSTKSLREYVLIGYPDYCGRVESWTGSGGFGEFRRVFLQDLQGVQVCTYDDPRDLHVGGQRNSLTYSFQRL